MKLLSTMAAALLLASPAFAVTWGGTVTAQYGFGENIEGTGAETIDGPYSNFAVRGSVGIAIGGNFNLQFDAIYDSAASQEYYTLSAYTFHAFMPVGQFNVGAFYGFGDVDHIENSDEGPVTWYGIEASREFGNSAVAMQLGLSTNDSDHNALDYEDQFFANA